MLQACHHLVGRHLAAVRANLYSVCIADGSGLVQNGGGISFMAQRAFQAFGVRFAVHDTGHDMVQSGDRRRGTDASASTPADTARASAAIVLSVAVVRRTGNSARIGDVSAASGIGGYASAGRIRSGLRRRVGSRIGSARARSRRAGCVGSVAGVGISAGLRGFRIGRRGRRGRRSLRLWRRDFGFGDIDSRRARRCKLPTCARQMLYQGWNSRGAALLEVPESGGGAD